MVQRIDLTPFGPAPDAQTVLVVAPRLVLSCARTAGVPLFERQAPVHCVLVGRARVEHDGRVRHARAIALPANTRHRVVGHDEPFAVAAYLDPRRYRFEDVAQLAAAWRDFVPGEGDLRALFDEALALPQPAIDPRVLRALDAMQHERLDVGAAAARVGLSRSRLAHLMTDAIGAPPRLWRLWLKLGAALGHALTTGASLTESAHVAGFSDSAHFTRTCRRLTGVRPAMMLPQTVYLSQAS
ncbi:MAG: helix-turn-helix transcriptional regulator [Myxococcales bacterium]|nr:helix-turn-helix transcriptional regulator [Myxococcales bacterium]